MMAGILESIVGIALNVISNVICDSSVKLMERFRKHRKLKALKKWIEEFLDTHHGIFDTEDFLAYIEHQQPFQKIIDFISTPCESLTEDAFLRKLVSDFTNQHKKDKKNCTTLAESEIYNFFKGIAEQYKQILFLHATDGEKYLAYQEKQDTAKELSNFQQLREQINTLINGNIENEKKIDSETEIEIYNLLSCEMWRGNFSVVRHFLPVLMPRSADLENAIKIKLGILSDFNEFPSNTFSMCQSIKCPEIRDDVIRLIVAKHYKKLSNISEYIPLITSQSLREIAENLASGNVDAIIKLTKVEKDCITEYRYGFADFPASENWLIRRICALRLCELPIVNRSEAIRALIDTPNIIDRVIIWENELKETMDKYGGENISRASDFINSVNDMRASTELYKHAHSELKLRFYLTLMRSMFCIRSPDLYDTLHNLPDDIASVAQIKAFFKLELIEKHQADENDILSFAIDEKEYWLIGAYFDTLKDADRVLNFIDKIKSLRGDNAQVLFYSVTALMRVKHNEEAFKLLESYRDIYAEYLDFWRMFYQIAPSKTEKQIIASQIETIVTKKKFEYGGTLTEIEITKILLWEKKYAAAELLLNTIEGKEIHNLDIVKLRIELYVGSDRYIDALTTICEHYDELKSNPRVIDLLLSISLQNKRPVAKEVLIHAKTFTEPRILLLVAKIEKQNGNHQEAKNLAMKALLNTPPEQDELVGKSFQFFIDENEEKPKPKYITDNCFVILEHCTTGTIKKFCIYNQDLLPNSGCTWKGAEHISRALAAEYGLIHKAIGSTINFGNDTYVVKNIDSIDAFYSQTCMYSMIQHKAAIPIYVKDASSAMQEIETALKKWTDTRSADQIYSDHSIIALPFYSLKKYTSVEYGELVRVFLEATSIVMREPLLPANHLQDKTYILTYSALIELNMLGINPSECCNTIIPSSVVELNNAETDSIYRYNSQDIVACAGMLNGKLSFVQKDEQTIEKHIYAALELQQYIAKFNTATNVKDLEIEEEYREKIKNLVGICDYDALALAHFNEYALITGEMVPTALAQDAHTKCEACGISDFLCYLRIPPIKLIALLKHRMYFRSGAVITPTVLEYLCRIYKEAENQKEILQRWKELLAYIEELHDDTYGVTFSENCAETIKKLDKDNIDEYNPILIEYALAAYYYIHEKYKIDAPKI